MLCLILLILLFSRRWHGYGYSPYRPYGYGYGYYPYGAYSAYDPYYRNRYPGYGYGYRPYGCY